MDVKVGDDWIARTSRGELCALLGCEEIPSVKCRICEKYYCYQHSRDHHHKV